MKTFFTVLLFFLCASLSFGQNDFDPQILILTPNEVVFEKVFEKEVAIRDRQQKNKSQLRKTGG